MIKVVVGSFLLLGFFVNAQEFQGKAEYFSKRIIKEKVEVNEAAGENEISPEMEKAFQEAMKKASEKQYLLSFNKSECLYEEQEQLQRNRKKNKEQRTKNKTKTNAMKKKKGWCKCKYGIAE